MTFISTRESSHVGQPENRILRRNLSSVEALISAHYPWALDMFRSYDVEVKRADVGRVFILHHYGGLYLDLDCRCFRDLADTLTDYDFVIQG